MFREFLKGFTSMYKDVNWRSIGEVTAYLLNGALIVSALTGIVAGFFMVFAS